MDIINVISVTGKATVNQWFEDNHDDVQESLYWRQAFDVRTMELSVRPLDLSTPLLSCRSLLIHAPSPH